MKDLLLQYKELTLRQKERLLQGDISAAVQLVAEKETIIDAIKEWKKRQNKREKGNNLSQENHSFEPLIKQINALNQEVITLMAQQQERIAAELRKLQQGKKMQQAYRPAYSPGAYFFDKKK